MKGCARSCLLLLLGWGVAAYGFYSYFVGIRDFGSPMYWGSAVAGLLVVAAIGYAVGIVMTHRERRLLLDAMAGTPLEDGKWAGVSGTIQATHPLTAPLSGERVVVYDYKIQRDERVGKSSSQIIYYDGKALAPSTIATRHGTVRLLAVPSLGDVQLAPLAQPVERARAYIAATQFTVYDTGKKRTDRLEDEWTDDDGQFRFDRQHITREIELADGFEFEERHIKQGEQVCAFGLYSRERGGLIPHPNWAKTMRIMPGDSARVTEQLRGRMIRYFIGVVVCSALVYGIVRLYHYQAATLPL